MGAYKQQQQFTRANLESLVTDSYIYQILPISIGNHEEVKQYVGNILQDCIVNSIKHSIGGIQTTTTTTTVH